MDLNFFVPLTSWPSLEKLGEDARWHKSVVFPIIQSLFPKYLTRIDDPLSHVVYCTGTRHAQLGACARNLFLLTCYVGAYGTFISHLSRGFHASSPAINSNQRPWLCVINNKCLCCYVRRVNNSIISLIFVYLLFFHSLSFRIL